VTGRACPLLFVHHRKELGGAPASLAQLLGALDRSRYDVHVYCPAGPAAALFRDAGATVHTGPVSCFTHIWASTYHGLRWILFLRELASLPAHVVAFRRVLGSQAFQIVHLNDSPLVAAAYLARRSGVPVVWHLRSALPEHDGRRSRFLRRVVRRLSAASIAITDGVAASFDAGSEVIPNSVDLGRFTPGEPEVPPAVAFIGFLYPWKGFREYLQAAALVRSQGLKARFLVVGGGVRNAAFFHTPMGRFLEAAGLAHDYEREAHELAAELGVDGAVSFVPYTPDLVPVYQACAVVVAPSQGPELPRPVIEAAACGVPVIASGSRSGGGIVVPGETGILVEPGSAESIADALHELLEDTEMRAKMGAAARAHAEDAFDCVKNARRVESIYRRVSG
jgi:glycosyltransferase involved in cell wall biosynthesis